MTSITFPSGEAIDFGDLPPEEIEPIVAQLQQEKPELFAKPEEELSVEEIFARSRAGDTGEETDIKAEDFTPTHEGELQDHSFQAWFGRADNAADREARLTQEFGEDSFIKISNDDYALKLDNIAPELKEKYDLP